MSHGELMSQIVGMSYPQAAIIEGGYLRRYWIARTAANLPTQETLINTEPRIAYTVKQSLVTAYENSSTPDKLEAACPQILLTRIDDVHLVVRIDFSGPERSVGDSAAISQWKVLQAIHLIWPFEELQGIPLQYWFFMQEGM